MRAAERRMAGERHLERRCENAYTRARALRRQQECRFGKIELQRNRLHRAVVECATIFEHAKRVAFERRFREDIDDPVCISIHAGSRATPSGSTVRAMMSRASARSPRDEISSTCAITA